MVCQEKTDPTVHHLELTSLESLEIGDVFTNRSVYIGD